MRRNSYRRQNVFKKYLPHNLLELKELRALWLFFFYATLVFGLYAAYNWIQVLQLPEEYWRINSAPLKQIYGYAAGASLLACAAELCVWRALKILQKTQEAVLKK